jgi:DNA mismatch repair protein MSH3
MEEQKGGMGVDERVSISMISICPSTGDVIYDEFEGKRFEIFEA